MQRLIIASIIMVLQTFSPLIQGAEIITNTINLGRFLVDVPMEVYVTGEKYHYIDSLDITKSTQKETQGQIQTRLNEINSPNSIEYVVSASKGAKAGSAIIVRRLKNYKIGGREIGYGVEGFFFLNGYRVLISDGASYNKLDLAMRDTNYIMGTAVPLKQKDIPAASGFCAKGIFFPGEPGYRHRETAEISLRLKEHPDFRIHLLSITNGKVVDAGLLSRVANKKLPAIFANLEKDIKEIRKGEHSIGAIQGEEILETLPADGGYSIHQFTWQSDGKANDIYAPSIVVDLESGELENGKKVRPSMSDKEAVALFDEIVNSIRVRPIK